MEDDIMKRIEKMEEKVSAAPHGTLTYKTIKGKKQPYLQWTEGGRTKSRYIKLDEREEVLEMIEERRNLLAEIRRLKEYYLQVKDILKKQPFLANQVSIGYQDYDIIRENDLFYVDKTHFIADWWALPWQVCLITRPRRFGKTLTMSMVECFFSTLYAGRDDLFENTHIQKWDKYQMQQGVWPVVFVTFSNVKSNNFEDSYQQVCGCIQTAYEKHAYLRESDKLESKERECFETYFDNLRDGSTNRIYCKRALRILCECLFRHYGKKVIILIDEYDTPLTEGYMFGYMDEISDLMRNIFQEILKTNPYLQRGLLSGISRVARESLFSDMNNIGVVSTTDTRFADVFGFTEQEVSNALQCQDIDEMDRVREWYDGFTFGDVTDIYNPWSITNYLKNRKLRPYWANSGGFELINKLVLLAGNGIKTDFVKLLQGGSIRKTFDETINYAMLEHDPDAIWAFLLATGYLRADNVEYYGYATADLAITNKETRMVFYNMTRRWFAQRNISCNDFCRFLLDDDVEQMNEYLQGIAMEMVSFFDVGRRVGEKEPERFYHGLVLGMVTELREQYLIRSNRESGFGRYDVMMIPKADDLPGIIIEFKVRREKKEASLEETVQAALAQIEEKQYEAEMISQGIPKERIRKYGFAFEGKQVLIEKGQS